MAIKLKPIVDPEKIEKTAQPIDNTMTLRKVKAQERFGSQLKDVKPKASDEPKNAKRIPKDFDCQQISGLVFDAIEETSARKTYYLGKGADKVFCGPVLQVIPVGGYAQIGKGLSISNTKPPIDRNKKIQYEKDRQVIIKVGNRVGKDYALVIGQNGCILLESGAYASLNMPVFIVEQTGDYYYLNHGHRIIILDSGCHAILYTVQKPIVYIRQQPEKPKSQVKKKPSQPSQPLQAKSTISNEPLDQMAEENKGIVKNISLEGQTEEPKPEEPKPEVAKPEMPKPEVAKPQVPKPEVAKPQVPKPELAKPQVPKPEVAKPQVPKPQVPKPELAKPQALKPEVAKPQVPKPELAKPQVPKPELAKPQVPKLELAKPQVPKLELAKPQVPKPELAKPQVPKPEVAKPEVAKPEVAKPQVPKPEEPKPPVLKPQVLKPQVPKQVPEEPKPHQKKKPVDPIPPVTQPEVSQPIAEDISGGQDVLVDISTGATDEWTNPRTSGSNDDWIEPTIGTPFTIDLTGKSNASHGRGRQRSGRGDQRKGPKSCCHCCARNCGQKKSKRR